MPTKAKLNHQDTIKELCDLASAMLRLTRPHNPKGELTVMVTIEGDYQHGSIRITASSTRGGPLPIKWGISSVGDTNLGLPRHRAQALGSK